MRGKHSAAAATRRAIQEAETSVSTYQRRVAKLTEENRALKDRLAAKDAAHSLEVKRLKAERNEGVSPMLSVVQRENKALRDRADHAERELREIRRLWDTAVRRLFSHFESEHGLKRMAAVEAALPIFGHLDMEGVTIASDYEIRQVRGVISETKHVAVERIQRARGER